jgi:YVTN family beta-propeller protein
MEISMTMTVSQSLLNLEPTVRTAPVANASLPATIAVGGFPFFPGMAANGSRLYVPIQSPANTLAVIDTATNTVVRNPITFGLDPHVAVVTPKGDFVYVTNLGSNSVSVMETAHNTVVATIPVGKSHLARW